LTGSAKIFLLAGYRTSYATAMGLETIRAQNK